MKEVTFTFRGKAYKGFLAASTEEYPHFYWCYIDDPDLVMELGDCISFKQDKGGLLQPSEYYPKAYREMIQSIKAAVEQSIVTTMA